MKRCIEKKLSRKGATKDAKAQKKNSDSRLRFFFAPLRENSF